MSDPTPVPNTFLVLSLTHSLLPLAARLEDAGHNALVLADRDPYELCWEGRFGGKLLTGGEKAPNGKGRQAIEIAARQHGATVVTDSHRWTKALGEAPDVWGAEPLEGTAGKLVLGGWNSPTGGPAAHHLWVAHGGGGVPSGGMLMAVPQGAFGEALEATLAVKLAEDGPCGPWRAHLDFRDGAWELVGLERGWQDLHWQAMDQAWPGGVVGMLAGDVAPPRAQFVFVGTVAVPPWPYAPLGPRASDEPARHGDHRREWLAAQRTLRWVAETKLPEELLHTPGTYLHDVRMDDAPRGSGGLRLAGVDGRVAVVAGASDLPVLAHAACQQRGEVLAAGMPNAIVPPLIAEELRPLLVGLAQMGVRLAEVY